MTSIDLGASCSLCDRLATVAIDPPRRTIARGVDPDDASFSVTAILPDVGLCAEHRAAVGEGTVSIGWCDDEQCRAYGEIGNDSPCGSPFKKIGPTRRS